VEKEYVIAEIRRTAEANGGVPLGVKRFAHETGIGESAWKGRFWARWGDAVSEAGYPPNKWGEDRYDPDDVYAKLCVQIRSLGRMPTEAELQMRRRQDRSFPTPLVYTRAVGPKAVWATKVADFCRDRAEWNDVFAIVAPLAVEVVPTASRRVESDDDAAHGLVYLAKSGRHHKIGRSKDAQRRRYEIALQLPERVTLIHEIRTDDPVGIERYWHERFRDRRANGEWFDLTPSDVAAFKRRKFM
jgi:hypothetical protein